jgi:hypothetical protein
LTVRIASGQPAGLGVALVVPDGEHTRRRVLLDAAIASPTIVEGSPPAVFSWPIWPDTPEPVLLLHNRGATAVRLAAVELIELAADLPPAALVEIHAEIPRMLGIDFTGPRALERFGAAVDDGPDDALALARNLATYLTHCGATAAILPEDLADRSRCTELDGQADEDSTGPDRLSLILRVFEQRGLAAILDLRGDGPLRGLPVPDSPEAFRQGLVRVDAQGLADGASYHPLHPDVRKAMKQRVIAALSPRKAHPNLAGLVIRLGPGPTLLGGPETGLDDATFERFVAEALTAEEARKAPGLGAADAGRFAARRQYLAGPGKRPWLSWRAECIGSLYADLSQAINEAAPGAILAVVTPGADDGPAGQEARRADRAGVRPEEAWKAVGLDLDRWPASGSGGPVVLRGVSLGGDDLARDLATHPGLDAPVARRTERGLLLQSADSGAATPETLALTAATVPAGPSGDEPLGHALAVLDARWIILAAAAVAGREERTARFARVFRALPADAQPAAARLESGVAVRSWTSGAKTYLELANDTPYMIRLDTLLEAPSDAPVDDLGRGLLLDPEKTPNGKRLVLNLAPFDVAAVRVGAPDVRVGKAVPYPLDDVKAQYQAILARLTSGSSASALPSPGFEPAGPREPVAEIRMVRAAPLPSGWGVLGDKANSAELDQLRPHTGSASLRLDAKAQPAAVASDFFAAPGGTSVTVRAWLRADPPGAAVRIRIEGEVGGSRLTRQAEFTAQRDWTELAVRAELPPPGIERVRLHFELLAPGRLWVDDVSIFGQGPSELVPRSHRILVTAMQAYREGRFADFARLAGSRWARMATAGPGSAIVPDGPADHGGPLRTGDASDLSPGRRLR